MDQKTPLKIALAVTDHGTNAQIKALKVDLVELRVDLFKKLDLDYILKQIKHRRQLKIPLLLTVRNQKKEGALKDWPDAQKRQIIEAALPLVDMVDIELSSPLLKEVLHLARHLKKKTVVSMHNFDHTPLHLENIFKKILSTRPNIIKIAAQANSYDDTFRMMDFTHRHRRYHLITVSIGSYGTISRLVLPAIGSMYAYTFLDKPTAPGQIDAKTLKEHLKFYYS